MCLQGYHTLHLGAVIVSGSIHKKYLFALNILFKFTNTKLKPYASPEKDYEVIMMQACDDVTINIYIDSIYLLYALQLKYNFLRSPDIVKLLICEIYDLENFRFNNCEHEREAIIFLIQYL